MSRFVVRILGLPETKTEEHLQYELFTLNIPTKKIWIAKNDLGNAGFGFVEFYDENSKELFMQRHYKLNLDDVIYQEKTYISI